MNRILCMLLAAVLLVAPVMIKAESQPVYCQCDEHKYGILPYVPGDLNRDRVIDAIDALYVLKESVSVTPSDLPYTKFGDYCYAMEVVDVNGDNLTDAVDALEILQYAVGKRQSFERTAVWPHFEEGYAAKRLQFIHSMDWRDQAISYTVTPYSDRYVFRLVYKMGADFVPVLVKDLKEQSDLYRVPYSTLFRGANALHLYVHRWFFSYEELWKKSGEELALEFLDLVHSVPTIVADTCDDPDMSFEQKVQRLDLYGLLALPFLAERIEAGETQWEICFENQLLGLSEQERFKVIESLYFDNDYFDAEKGPDLVYQLKTASAVPLDVSKWVEENQDTLATLKEWCLG